MKSRHFALVVLFWITTLSCRESSAILPSSPSMVFPHGIGTRWTYAIYDSLARSLDTASVRVVDTTRLPNGTPAFVFQYTYTSNIDTQLVSFLRDTVVFYSRSRSPYSTFGLVFPLEVGPGWGTSFVDFARVNDCLMGLDASRYSDVSTFIPTSSGFPESVTAGFFSSVTSMGGYRLMWMPFFGVSERRI
ncbi:MAG: hypothetical protein HYR76_08995 [Ignavibacteria bacterium]|nr:hypothetical protein [Ignavibacteria bacterium]